MSVQQNRRRGEGLAQLLNNKTNQRRTAQRARHRQPMEATT